MNINVEFTPYEQALELKELGFDEECLAWHNSGRLFIDSYNNINSKMYFDYCCSLPLYQQAFRWFRDNHRIHLVIGVAYDKGRTFYIRIETGPTWGYQYFDVEFLTYEEAQLAALKKMIEIVKNK